MVNTQRTVSGSSGGSDILSRAKASVEKDFGQNWEQQEERKQQERQRQAKEQQIRQQRERQEQQARQQQERQKQQERQRSRNQQQEHRRMGVVQESAGGVQEDALNAKELERRTQEMLLGGGLSVDPRRFMGQEESLDLDAVWELMVKGPNLELAFERDFIAEGVEMLNRIQA